jgi:hypothetical protein
MKKEKEKKEFFLFEEREREREIMKLACLATDNNAHSLYKY